MLLALVEIGHGLLQQRVTLCKLVAFNQRRFLAGLVIIDEPVLPLSLTVGTQRRVQRVVGAGHPAVHVDHLFLGDIEVVGDLLHVLGREVTIVDGLHLPLELAQVEEQLLLRRGCAHLHQRPGPQDVLLDRGADPPHGVGRQAEALVSVEPLDRLHHPDVALGNQIRHGQAVAAVPHSDLRDEAKVGCDHLVRRLGIAPVGPRLGQHEFFVGRQHRKLTDFVEVAGKVAFPGQTRDRCDVSHGSSPSAVPRRPQVVDCGTSDTDV